MIKKLETLKEVSYFIGLAFGIPLICCLLIGMIPIFQSGVYNLILYGIQGATPTLAAVLVIALRRSPRALGIFLKQKYRCHFSVKYCLLGLIIPAVVLTIGKLMSNQILPQDMFFTWPSSKKLMIIAWALLAEELGWRGYLQDKLEELVGARLTPLFVGVIWTLWHYHFFLMDTMEVPLLAFTYGCIAESYGYYMITKKAKGNILPASLWHFSGNLFFNCYLINPNWNNGSMVPYVIVNCLYTIYIIAMLGCTKNNKEEAITMPIKLK